MSDIDELGRVQAQLKRISKLYDMLKNKILGVFSNGEHMGEDYVLSITGKDMERFDLERFKMECPNVYSQYLRTVSYREVTTRKRET